MTGLMLVLWLGLLALAISPALHQFLHSDSHHLSHECLLTSFTKSHLLFACVAMAVAAMALVGFQLVLREQAAPNCVRDLRLGPGRAPPASSFFSSVR
jgi:hypothetical protein